jgi:hypothetical protein
MLLGHQNIPWRKEITIRITIAVCLVFLSIFIITMFLLVSDQQYKEDIKFAAAVIGGAAAIYTAYHA